jgi:aminoglycoside 2'-N-acetyltransferase I
VPGSTDATPNSTLTPGSTELVRLSRRLAVVLVRAGIDPEDRSMEKELLNSQASRVEVGKRDSLSPNETASVRALLWAAFGDGEDAMTEDDWRHAQGGLHFVAESDGEIVAYASVAERWLEIDGRPMRTGYVEAVATAVGRQGRGLGSLLMREVNAYIRDRFQLGALGTGRHGFYERLGWLTWKGPTWVRAADGPRRTPDEDGYILVLPTPTSPELDLTAAISCDFRSGDAW